VHYIVRGSGRISLIVGWVTIALMIPAIVVPVIVAMVTRQPMVLIFLISSIPLFIGGGVNLWIGKRTRLEIQPDQFIWCGFYGPPKSLPWHTVRQILLPPRGSHRRLAAIAALHDGTFVEIESLWESPMAPRNLLVGHDHSQAQHALIEGHKAFLASLVFSSPS